MAGSKRTLSIEKCQGLETQKWDFSIYPPGSPAKQEESTENAEEADGQNPALAKKILKEVLKIYDKTPKGRYSI